MRQESWGLYKATDIGHGPCATGGSYIEVLSSVWSGRLLFLSPVYGFGESVLHRADSVPGRQRMQSPRPTSSTSPPCLPLRLLLGHLDVAFSTRSAGPLTETPRGQFLVVSIGGPSEALPACASPPEFRCRLLIWAPGLGALHLQSWTLLLSCFLPEVSFSPPFRHLYGCCFV